MERGAFGGKIGKYEIFQSIEDIDERILSAETERESGIESIELCERDTDGGESSSDAENSSRGPSPGIMDGKVDQELDTEMGADDMAGLRGEACGELEQEQVANSEHEREDKGVINT